MRLSGRNEYKFLSNKAFYKRQLVKALEFYKTKGLHEEAATTINKVFGNGFIQVDLDATEDEAVVEEQDKEELGSDE